MQAAGPSTAVVALAAGGLGLALFFYRRRQHGGRIVRRAAFDIGSGASKVLVCEVDVASGMLVGEPLFEAERPCAFKADAQASADGALSADIRSKGDAIIAALVERAKREGATEACGIATEVFRTAPNGLSFLTELEAKYRVPISILSQADEARLGLATAEAHGGADAAGAAWDSGGGSFQITARAPPPAAAAASSASSASPPPPVGVAALRTFVGKLGTGPAYERLVVAVRGRAYDASASAAARCNPVSEAEADGLVRALQRELPPPPAWLAGTEVVAIGAFNSIFAVTLRAKRLLVDGGAAAAAVATTPGTEGARGNGTLTLADARAALTAACGRSDAQLQAIAGHGADAEGPHLVVPKIALLVAVAEHARVARVRYRRSTGGCAGLMALGTFSKL